MENTSKYSINENDVKKFQDLYKQKFGKELSNQNALEQGLQVVNLLANLISHNNTVKSSKNNSDDNILI